MGRAYAAIDIRSGSMDVMLGIIDDYAPTAFEERGEAVRAFFSTSLARDAAQTALTSAGYLVSAVDVDDEDWARRSQQDLAPVTVGRLTIFPNTQSPHLSPQSTDLALVIEPSMGFGTGHHATTRLCLAALQTFDLSGRFVLDVGTGSGILALAAGALGAARATGIDNDPDAIRSATENLALNPIRGDVEFRVSDLTTAVLPSVDVIVANLTGAMLVRVAPRLRSAVGSGGVLVVSGLLADQRQTVIEAFGLGEPIWEQAEQEWVVLALKPSAVK